MKPWQYTLIGFILIVALAMIMSNVASGTCTPEVLKNLAFIVIVCGATWGGSVLINKFICGPLMAWGENPVRRLLKMYLVGGTYAIVLMVISFRIWELLDAGVEIPGTNYIIYSVFSLLITLLVTSIYAISDFMKQWKQSELKAEHLKQQMLKSEYESLKNQVNPHFLFNSLNTLTALIGDDPEKATDFVQRLSRVFRYALQNQEKNTVDLASEAEIVSSYLFLQKMRFGDNLRFHVDIPVQSQGAQVITQGLLTLAENAIKHNEASAEHPLHIDISMEGMDYVIVKNSLRRKKMSQPSTGIGLPNLINRCQGLTEKPVIITENNNEFIVKLPVIEITSR
jgi:two-component system LytT family sensor kinase